MPRKTYPPPRLDEEPQGSSYARSAPSLIPSSIIDKMEQAYFSKGFM